MKTKNIKIPLLAILFAGFLSSCSQSEANNEENNVVVNEQKNISVKVLEIKEQTINRTLPYMANLNAFKVVHYAPASPGHIKKIFVDVDSRVAKGDLIAMMDNTQLETARIQLENAESNYRRVDTLYRLNSISEQQYESAKNGYELAKANVEFMTENTKLTSPITGIITGKYYEGNELYTGAPNTSAGKAAIVTIMQINPLKAIINVPESYYPNVKKGMKAEITSSIYKDKIFYAEIYRVSPVINSSSRSFNVELIVDNEKELLRPGMFTNVNLNIGQVNAIIVPAISVLKQSGTNNRYIYIIDKDSLAKKVNVEVINRYNDKIEISSDNIHEGDMIVIAGQEKLDDGAKVKIIK